MAFLQVNNVKLVGVTACVPPQSEENSIIYEKWGGYESFVSTTGIERRRISDNNTCSSDLCVKAAENLISELSWQKDSIDALVFVSQSPDYLIPATSCLLQEKLRLSENCYTLDISLGCSGWVYALSVIASLMQNGTIRRGLLLAGDTISKFCSKDDKSTYPLFGDAGTATALEYSEGVEPISFVFNTDGSGKEAIIINDGGYRNPTSLESFNKVQHGVGVVRNNLQLVLDGMSVFSFGISKAPKSVDALLASVNQEKDLIDYFLFHQANLFMNEKIRKKLKLQPEKVPYCLKDFGNTSCASIPLTMVTQIPEQLRSKEMNLIGCGFGVGLSWGSVLFHVEHIVCPDLIEFNYVL